MSIWERSWKIDMGTHGLKGATFVLERHFTSPIDFYTMKIQTCGNSEAWANCKLVHRGRYFQPWAPLPPLHPFDPADPDAYQPPIAEWLKGVSAATMRLEGELEIAVPPAMTPVLEICIAPLAVTMWLAKDAVKFAPGRFRDLMIVRVRSQGMGLTIVPGPDGTGHGDPT